MRVLSDPTEVLAGTLTPPTRDPLAMRFRQRGDRGLCADRTQGHGKLGVIGQRRGDVEPASASAVRRSCAALRRLISPARAMARLVSPNRMSSPTGVRSGSLTSPPSTPTSDAHWISGCLVCAIPLFQTALSVPGDGRGGDRAAAPTHVVMCSASAGECASGSRRRGGQLSGGRLSPNGLLRVVTLLRARPSLRSVHGGSAREFPVQLAHLLAPCAHVLAALLRVRVVGVGPVLGHTHRCRGTTRAYDARRACREPVGRPFRRLPERNVLRRVPLARQLPRIRRSESFLDDVMALPDVPHPLEFDRGHVRQVVASRSK